MLCVAVFVFVLASTRRDGNSEALARAAASALPADVQQRWVRLLDHPLLPFFDTRHSAGYVTPEGHERTLVDATLAATDLVIVTPVNWYSVSWLAKLYLDHWSAWMRIPKLAFKSTLAGRRMWGVVVDSGESGTADGSSAPVVDTLRRTAEYMGMQWGGALLGHANRPGELSADALADAATFFTRR
ncbi:MAG: NAD(P)H-dependent oxidoreductase [Deltaproteobacteria bacterium]|nr:NAD(P)H-dependent oxidoreductase [Deltaproteobacteria bacterium]